MSISPDMRESEDPTSRALRKPNFCQRIPIRMFAGRRVIPTAV
jgi:hypothetical protein